MSSIGDRQFKILDIRFYDHLVYGSFYLLDCNKSGFEGLRKLINFKTQNSHSRSSDTLEVIPIIFPFFFFFKLNTFLESIPLSVTQQGSDSNLVR